MVICTMAQQPAKQIRIMLPSLFGSNFHSFCTGTNDKTRQESILMGLSIRHSDSHSLCQILQGCARSHTDCVENCPGKPCYCICVCDFPPKLSIFISTLDSQDQINIKINENRLSNAEKTP